MSTYAVSEASKITPTTLLLTLKRKSGAPLLFQPGQYAAIYGYHKGRPMPIRCFSIVSSPTEQDILQFSTRVRGRFTRALATLQPGDLMHVQGPYGGFVLNTAQQKHIVMLAGGIGITPFMSMVRFASITRASTKIDLLYSVATQDDVPFGEELLDLQRQNSNFQPTFVIDHGPTQQFPAEQTTSGRITPEIVEGVNGSSYDNAETMFYICGPPPFMRGMVDMLHSHGVPKSRILTEAFSQGPNRQTGKVRDWPFSMYALGALGLSASSVAIMIADLRAVLPPKNSLQAATKLTTAQQVNNRQSDLDTLINSLPTPTSSAPASSAVKTAQAAANQPAATTTQTQTTNTVTPTAVTPATAPTPACTTTQSGVTKC